MKLKKWDNFMLKESVEREWLAIFMEFTKDQDHETNIFKFFNWLETNYNAPTKK